MGVHVVVAGGRIGAHPHVLVDDHAAGSPPCGTCSALGHRRIGMIRTSDTEGTYWSSDAERTRGYRDCAGRGRDRPVDPDVRRHQALRLGGRRPRHGGACWRSTGRPPRCSATPTRSRSARCHAPARPGPRGCPEDVSLIGVDGHPQAELFGITTVDQAVHEQGRIAGEMAMNLTLGRPLESRVRSSCRPGWSSAGRPPRRPPSRRHPCPGRPSGRGVPCGSP